jgi:hypothetical protein
VIFITYSRDGNHKQSTRQNYAAAKCLIFFHVV